MQPQGAERLAAVAAAVAVVASWSVRAAVRYGSAAVSNLIRRNAVIKQRDRHPSLPTYWRFAALLALMPGLALAQPVPLQGVIAVDAGGGHTCAALSDGGARCWGYNGRVHGPTIEAGEGDRVRVYVTNRLPAPTTVHWHGLRIANEMPLAIERAAIAPEFLPDPDVVTTSLYAALEERNARPVHATQRISARNVDAEDALLLGVQPGDAALQIERVSRLASGRVIEFTRSVYRGDAYDFVAELTLTKGPA